MSSVGHSRFIIETAYTNQGFVFVGRINYRILYLFHGQNVAILAHAFTKEKEVPDRDIERAIERKVLLEKNLAQHTYMEE